MGPNSTGNTTDTTTIDLRDPGDLLAATPHLLGFEPSDSVVLIGHRGEAGTHIGNIVRADLPLPGGETALAAQMVDPLAHASVAVTVVVVGGRRMTGTTGPPAGAVVAAVKDVFGRAGTPVQHALWVPAIRAGAPWKCYDDDCCAGHLPDPRSTVLAAVTTHAGLVTHSSRAAMQRQLDPVGSDVLARRAVMLNRRVTTGGLEEPAALSRGRAAIRGILTRAWEGTPTLSDTEVVESALGLTLPAVRDACLAMAVPVGSAHSITAERVWLLLTRHTPAPERAEPATLLAYSAYVRGEGALAGMALSAARAADPDHLLSRLLSQALDHGLPPETLAGLARSGDTGPIWTAPSESLGTGTRPSRDGDGDPGSGQARRPPTASPDAGE